MSQHVLPFSLAIALVAGGQGMLLVLGALVVLRKIRRDRSERASARRRAEFAAALHDGSHRLLRTTAAMCVRSDRALSDLVYVLRAGEQLPEVRRAALLRAARRSGLIAHLRRRLSARRATARGMAVLGLSALRVPGTVPRLARLLSDRDADVRLAACTALADTATAEAAAALIAVLGRCELPPERLVERLGAPWAAPVVHAALKEGLASRRGAGPGMERGSSTVLQLVKALGIARYAQAEPELLELLTGGDHEERISAARALGGAGSPRSIPALVAALASDSWPLRARAAKSLGRLRAVVATDAVAACLADDAWWVRKQAGRALRRLGPPGILALRLFLNHPDRYARDRAAEELGLETLANEVASLGAEPPMAAKAVPQLDQTRQAA